MIDLESVRDRALKQFELVDWFQLEENVIR